MPFFANAMRVFWDAAHATSSRRLRWQERTDEAHGSDETRSSSRERATLGTLHPGSLQCTSKEKATEHAMVWAAWTTCAFPKHAQAQATREPELRAHQHRLSRYPRLPTRRRLSVPLLLLWRRAPHLLRCPMAELGFILQPLKKVWRRRLDRLHRAH